MFRNTQANPNGYSDEKIFCGDYNPAKVACNSWIRKIFCGDYNPKAVNPIYATFKGGYGGWKNDMSQWDYFCLWGHLRFCYNKTELIDGWTHIGLHGYRNGYTYTPVKNLLWNFNWHIAYNKKWPFIKIGFNRIWPLYEDA